MLLFTQSRQVGFAYSNQERSWSKIKKQYINFRDHRNRAIDKVTDTSSTIFIEMDGKPISGRGYRPCFEPFLLNVQCPNEINKWVTLLEILGFLKRRTSLNHTCLWAKIIRANSKPPLIVSKISCLFCNFFKTWQSFER